MSAAMDESDRMAFDDALREANLTYQAGEAGSAWFGTIIGVVLGVVALTWLLIAV